MADKEEKKVEGPELKDQEQKPVRIPVNSDGYIDIDKLTPEQLEKYSANSDTINKVATLASGIVDWVQHEAYLKYEALLEDSGSNGQPEELQKLSLDAMEFVLDCSSGEFTGVALWPSALAPIFSELDSLKKRLWEAKYTGTLEEFITPAEDPETGKAGFSFDLWQTENVPPIRGHRVKTLDYPTDKINRVVWNNLPAGTQEYKIRAEPNNSKEKINIYYKIDFQDINDPVVQQLDSYDKLVYIAVGGLRKAGNAIITLTQIYHAMGYSGKPSKYDRDKIDSTMSKFRAIIHLNNEEEINAKFKYPAYKYDGPLLQFYRRRKCDRVNGQLVEVTYYLAFTNPSDQIPLIQFAIERGQVAALSLKVLQAPISNTKYNLSIEDYLILRIKRAQSGSEPTRILFSSIFKHANLTEYKQKERARNTIIKFLDHCITCGEIQGYTTDKTGISLSLQARRERKQKN